MPASCQPQKVSQGSGHTRMIELWLSVWGACDRRSSMHPLPSNTWGSCLQEPPRGRKSLGGEYKGPFQKHKNFLLLFMSVLRMKRREGWLLQVTATYIVEVMSEGVEAGTCRPQGTVQSQVNKAFFFLREHWCHRASGWAISAALFLFKGLWGHLVPRAYYVLVIWLFRQLCVMRNTMALVTFHTEDFTTNWRNTSHTENVI